MLANMSSKELSMWQAYFRVLDREQEQKQKEGEKGQKAHEKARKGG